MKTPVLVLMFLLTASLLVVGCGGDDTTTTTAPVGTDTTTAGTTETTAGGGDSGPIKVGVILPLTGPAAAPAASVKNGLELEIEAINAAGGIGGRQIELVIEDDGSVVDKAVAAATKLIQQDNVTAILGPFPPYELPATRQMTEEAQIPQIIYQPPSLQQVSDTYLWSFTNQQGVRYNGSAAAQMMKEAGYKKVVLVHDTIPTFVESVQMTAEFGRQAGIEMIVAPDTWDDGETDLTPVLTKIAAFIQNANPDAVYIGCNVPSFPVVVKTLRSLGVSQPVIGAPSVGHPATFSQGPEAVEGVEFASVLLVNAGQGPSDYEGTAVAVEFDKRYTEKYGQPADFFSGFGYDTAHILEAGLKGGGDDKAKIRDALESITDLQLANGKYTYTPEDHLGVHDGYFQWKIEGGKYVLVKQLDPEPAQ
ncbi:MAG: ABC transporter substrate-binding protein [Thermoleophilia bacterium]|nr:ABC transporter substrate-binding protein [Thermoleophilia bacterium]